MVEENEVSYFTLEDYMSERGSEVFDFPSDGSELVLYLGELNNLIRRLSDEFPELCDGFNPGVGVLSEFRRFLKSEINQRYDDDLVRRTLENLVSGYQIKVLSTLTNDDYFRRDY